MPFDVTRMMCALEPGDPKVAEELLPLVCEALRDLAAARLAREGGEHTLQPTALVHEAWLKLAGSHQSWNGRGHFFAAAAEAMRRILIDRARQRNRLRHGAGQTAVQLESVDLAVSTDDSTLRQLNEALEKFALESPDKAGLVKMRYFVGLSLAEAGAAQGVSLATAKRRWAYARAWLYCELAEQRN